MTALRYHNVYGPRMPRDTPYAGVASIFRSALAAGEAPRVFEDGGQRRDFVHVRDVARANLHALAGDTPGAFNVASGTPRTVLDMAAALSRALEGPEPVVTGEWRAGDVRHVFASAAAATERLGFRASRGLRRRHARVRRRAAEGIATAMPRFAVVGHVEWIEFARVPRVPRPGEILHATEWWEDVGGGGAVAAVQLAKLAGDAEFFTALAEDERGRRSQERLEEMGVTVHAAPRPGDQRSGFVYLDDDHERTITIRGERIVPHGDDDLPWELLDEVDAVYFTGGDVGALKQSRRARRLVATPRAYDTLRDSRRQSRRARALGQGSGRAAGRGAPRPGARRGGLDRRQGGRPVGRRGPDQRQLKAAELPGPPRRLRRRRLLRGRAHVRPRRRTCHREGARGRLPLRRLQARRPRALRQPAHRREQQQPSPKKR